MSEEAHELKLDAKNLTASLKSQSLNTIITFATLILVSVIAYALWTHAEEARTSSSLFVGAVREQTTAMREATTVQRENNCLQSYQGPPQEKASFCRTVSR